MYSVLYLLQQVHTKYKYNTNNKKPVKTFSMPILLKTPNENHSNQGV